MIKQKITCPHEIKIRLCSYWIILFITIFSVQLKAQSISVSGKVAASRYPVMNASVTFINNADTTTRFTAITDASGNFNISVPTSVADDGNNIPTKFALEQNYPNPFSSSTAIPYEIKKESNVQVTIYDILGRVVRKFDAGPKRVGTHSILWNGQNNFGQRVASGVYFYRLQAGNESQVKKMIYNQGSSNIVSIPRGYSAQMPTANNEIKKVSSTDIYKVRIENTESSSLYIVAQEFDNILVQHDTTIDFSVGYIPLSNVDLDSLRQIIRGYGASNILLWRPDMTDSEIQTAFGTGDGQLGFSILRIMVEADSTRWSLYLPTVKKAQSMGVTIIASPWYAPSNLVETVNGVSRVRHDKYAEYANHLNSFIKYMSQNGASLYGVSVQNEPDITNQWTSWTANEIFTFMHDYADSIQGTKVMAPESFHFDRSYSDPILNDSVACANTDIVCGHIYGGGLADYPLARQKGKEVWMTEYLINSDGNGANMDTSWNAALATATSINSCMNANMSAYVWWYIVRYYGPIGDGTAGFGQAKGVVTRKGYVMSQFSRFIRPGYYRVDSDVNPTLTTTGVSITAYKDPATSKIIIIGVNTSSDAKEHVIRIKNGSLTNTFSTYTTSATKNCKRGDNISTTDGTLRFTFEPLSITTFVSN